MFEHIDTNAHCGQIILHVYGQLDRILQSGSSAEDRSMDRSHYSPTVLGRRIWLGIVLSTAFGE